MKLPGLRCIAAKKKISVHNHCINDCVRRWSEWGDSNSRRLEPKSSALPTGPHPDIELERNARCGQICGQGNSTTFSGNFQERLLGEIGEKQGSVQHFRKSNQFGAPAPKEDVLSNMRYQNTPLNSSAPIEYLPPVRYYSF